MSAGGICAADSVALVFSSVLQRLQRHLGVGYFAVVTRMVNMDRLNLEERASVRFDLEIQSL